MSTINHAIVATAMAVVYDLQELWVAAIDLQAYPIASRVTTSSSDLMAAITDYCQDPRPWREQRVIELTGVFSRYVAKIHIGERSIVITPSMGDEVYAIRRE